MKTLVNAESRAVIFISAVVGLQMAIEVNTNCASEL